jgi:RimJ/RimL family protein N-acetyltransferase
MDLMESGAVRGKSLTSYAVGSKRLMSWLDRNPRVDFQALDTVLDPVQIGKNRRFMAILPVRKVDLYGRGIKNLDKKRISFNMLSAEDLVHGATLSDGGKVVFALPSRDNNGDSNIRLSVERLRDLIVNPETVDMVATEYGVANLSGRTVRERAQALVDIAHPDDREQLVEEAKKKNILYADQIFLAECSYLYPSHITNRKVFKDDVDVLFRAIRPSDEEAMRRLFYRFSDEAIFYRYFSPIKAMPHTKMQKYVNADCNIATSIVGVLESNNKELIIAEARFVRLDDRPYAEVAFLVEEKYQGLGIGTYLFKMLIRLAKERGLRGFTADVLPSNQSMVKVFEKGGHSVHSKLMDGLYHITIPFHKEPIEQPIN